MTTLYTATRVRPHIGAEAAHIIRTQMDDAVCFTFVQHRAAFSKFDLRELLLQIRLWRSLGCKCLAANIRERDLGGVAVWMFVVQPSTEIGLCPLALTLGVAVDGYTYIVKDRSVAELVVRALA